jgi:hypothetical protein
MFNAITVSIDRSDPQRRHTLPRDAGRPRLVVTVPGHPVAMTLSYYEHDDEPYVATIRWSAPDDESPVVQVTRHPRLLKWLKTEAR